MQRQISEAKRSSHILNIRFYAKDVCLHEDIAQFYQKCITYAATPDVEQTMALINKIENLRDRSDSFQFKLLNMYPDMSSMDQAETLSVLNMLKSVIDFDDKELVMQEDMAAYYILRPDAEQLQEEIDEAFLASVEDYDAIARLIDMSHSAEDRMHSKTIHHAPLADDKDKYVMPDQIRVLARDMGSSGATVYDTLRMEGKCLSVFPKFDMDDGFIHLLAADTNTRHKAIYSKPVIRAVMPEKNRIEFIFVEERDRESAICHVTLALPLDMAVAMMEEGMRRNQAMIESLKSDGSLTQQFIKIKMAEAEREGWQQLRTTMENVAHIHLRDPVMGFGEGLRLAGGMR